MNTFNRILVTTLIVLATAAQVSRAEPSGLGLGIILGEPTGLCAKKWLCSASAIDVAAAWSFQGDGSFQIHADYLLHTGRYSEEYRERLFLYYGLGGRFRLNNGDGKDEIDSENDGDDIHAGIRIPLGVTYLFTGAPFDAFFEIVPIMDVVPSTDFTLTAAIGVRYYLR